MYVTIIAILQKYIIQKIKYRTPSDMYVTSQKRYKIQQQNNKTLNSIRYVCDQHRNAIEVHQSKNKIQNSIRYVCDVIATLWKYNSQIIK